MSTIEDIVENLLKISEDKKALVTARYLDHSNWLKKELHFLQQLIQRDPRNSEASEESPILVTDTADAVINTDFTDESEKDNSQRQKRKSPENCTNGIRVSPDHKRTSADYAELAVEAGLPADLNKMKKEHLLEELEKRGVVDMTMKALKKDLVEILKGLLVDMKCRNLDSNFHSNESHNENEPNGEELLHNSESEPTLPIPNITSNTNAATGRKASIISEYRTKIQNPMIIESEAERQARVEKGFKERMGRHRDSQARKSQIMAAMEESQTHNPVENADESNAVVPDKEVTGAEETAELMSCGHRESSYEPSPTPSPEKCTATESTWMEVASPAVEKGSTDKDNNSTTIMADHPPIAPPAAVTIAAAPLEEKSKYKPLGGLVANAIRMFSPSRSPVVTMAPVVPPPVPVPQVNNIVMNKSNAPSIQNSTTTTSSHPPSIPPAVPSSTTTVDHIATALRAKTAERIESYRQPTVSSSVPATTTTAPASPIVKAPVAATGGAAIKKPSNLVGSQSSFLPGASNAKPKQNIPALKLAQAKKLQEEAKQKERDDASKKKEIDKKEKKELANKKEGNNTTNATTISTAQSAVAKKAAGAEVSKPVTMSQTARPLPPTASSSTTGNTNTAAKHPMNSKQAMTQPQQQHQPLNVKPAVTTAVNKVPTTSTTTQVTKPATQSSVPFSKATAVTINKEPIEDEDGEAEEYYEAYEEGQASESEEEEEEVENDENVPPPTTQLPPAATATATASKLGVLSDNSNNKGGANIPAALPVKPKMRGSMIGSQMPPQATATGAVVVAVVSQPGLAPRNSEIEESDEEEDEDQYEIVDRESSDSDTEDEGEEESNKPVHQTIPEWARGPALKEALERQYGLNGGVAFDPDSLFSEVSTCSLEEIFNRREGKQGVYSKRGSSAHWDADKITLYEKRSYRDQMGFAK